MTQPAVAAVRASRLRDLPRLTTPLLDDTVFRAESELETGMVREGVKDYQRNAQEATRRGAGSSLKPAERLLVHWFEIYSSFIELEQKEVAAGLPGQNRDIYGPVLAQAAPGHLAVIAMHEAVSACMAAPSGVKTVALSRSIGRAVFAEINLNILAKSDKEAMREYVRRFREENKTTRANWWARRNTPEALRDLKAMVHTGAFLLGLLTDVAVCGDVGDFSPERRPAFASKSVWVRHNRRCSYTKMTRDAWAVIKDGHDIRKRMRPAYLPMVMRPCRWSKDAQGGYIRIRTPLICNPSPTQKAALGAADLDTLYDHLEAVTSPAHRVNRAVLKWQGIVWDQGGNALGIPRREDLPEPPHPAGYHAELRGKRGCWAGVPVEEKRRYKSQAHAVCDQNRGLRAERFTFLRKRTVAELMEGHEKVWFPHKLCFRGRGYPIPPFLNVQGDDLARGLLEWGDYVEPGAAGHRELLIEAANQYGFDKLPYHERIQWAQDHEKQIAAAARDPLDNDWWHPVFNEDGVQVSGAESPWQFLAACIALNDREAAGHATVWRDATCSGLQQYSALARDPVGAAAVNLLPGDRPSDVYAKVSDRALLAIKRDLVAGREAVNYRHRRKRESDWGWTVEERTTTVAALAGLVHDHTNRKTIKNPMMVNLYGGTYIGSSYLVQDALKSRGVKGELLFPAARYLTGATLGAMGEVCEGARAVMDYLRQSASIIASGDEEKDIPGNPVRWTTPLSLPVVQPYRRYRTVQVHTRLAELDIPVEDDSVDVDRRKQRTAFPPNFIHSIDSTHMFMAARRCRDEGLSFAARHDAFGTHAAHQPRLAAIIRQTFVELHLRPLLLELTAELRRRNPWAKLPDPPPPGTLDIRKALVSDYLCS